MVPKSFRNKILSFKDQQIFIGIDVHKKSWQITIRCMEMELQTFSMNPSPKELADHLKNRFPDADYLSAYEAGFCGFWIYYELINLEIDTMVIHAADVPTTNKEKLNKTDKIDSRKIARCLENGSLRPLYIPGLEHQQLRSLNRLRFECSRHSTRLKNRIKGYLNYYGVHLSDQDAARHWSSAFIAELETLSSQPHAGSKYLRFTLDELKHQRCRLSQITRELRIFCRQSSHAATLYNLLSVPGVGFVTAMTLLTEVIDINRFKKLDHLCSFVGIVPTCNASGDKERTGGLTPRKNKYLKHLIIEAAWIAIRRDPELTHAFSLLIGRMSKTDAITRIAKKLLNRIRHVWKNQVSYKIYGQIAA